MKGYLSVTFQDSFGQSTVRQYELAEATGANVTNRMVNLRFRASGVLSSLQSLTGAKVTKVALVIDETELNITANIAEAGSNITDDGVLSVALVNGGRGYIRIPSPKLSMVDKDGKPNISKPEWLSFATAFSGLYGTLSDGEYVDTSSFITGIVKTWRASRGSRNS